MCQDFRLVCGSVTWITKGKAMEDNNKGEFIRTMTGRVKYFKSSYGFIIPDDTEVGDVFVHHTDIEPWRQGFKELEKGQVVKFDLYKTDKGRSGQSARNVEVQREKVDMKQFKTLPDNIGNQGATNV